MGSDKEESFETKEGFVFRFGAMGSDKEESFETKAKEPKRVVKTYTACLWSFLVSLTGGLMLAWWEYEYHPTYRQLWMVPFGLILFTTPVIIWFAIFVSDICSFTEHVRPPDGSVHDPEKMIKKVISASY
ncbi:Uncharacterized protein TCM_005055 [Theobroma cacao]|uniref:Uncharacterized protein n=1 Tax=Theobroma cacao TaxID=3641 RepID=A0A061DS31_THECC|nr:Uncharacterized protein TCM_005055 [Theobroma cacao]